MRFLADCVDPVVTSLNILTRMIIRLPVAMPSSFQLSLNEVSSYFEILSLRKSQLFKSGSIQAQRPLGYGSRVEHFPRIFIAEYKIKYLMKRRNIEETFLRLLKAAYILLSDEDLMLSTLVSKT